MQKNQRYTKFHCQESHKNSKLTFITYMKSTCFILMWTLCAAKVSVRPYEPCLVDLEEHVVLMSSISSDSYNFASLSSMDASTPKARTK